MKKLLREAQNIYVKREKNQKQEAKITLSIIEQMTQVKRAYWPKGSRLSKEETRKGNTPRDSKERN
jgi:hypothetical protein